MSFNSLDELRQNRENWLESTKKNNFNLDDLLAKPYSDPAHFIFELLQNADDAGAKEVEFDIKSNCLIMHHNAKRDFDLNDIEGVSRIGNSSKKEELTPIGKFGLGFKSVFAITETPIIYSGIFRIKIKDFVLPVPVDGPNSIVGTQIILPFNNPSVSKEEAYEIISRLLPNLKANTLLFLNNILKISWNYREGHYFLSKSYKYFHGINGVRMVKISSATANEEYIVLHKYVKIDGMDLKIEVAYKLSKVAGRGKIITPLEQSSKLVVYFPTEKETFLNFIIQGPYKTTPNREGIPIDDEKNKRIVKATADLVAESISKMKKIHMINASFMKTLPLEEGITDNYIYVQLFKKVKDRLLLENLIPTIDKKYAKPSEIAIPKNPDLTKILTNSDLKELFSIKKWISLEMLDDSKDQLRKYLVNVLGIRQIGNKELVEAIDDEFMKKKNDKWLKGFYKYVEKDQTLWKVGGNKSPYSLRYKPIVRLETGEMSAPFDEKDIPLVYLSSDDRSKYRTVKRDFFNDKMSLRFLKELGLAEPDIFSEIVEFILPKYAGGLSEPDKDYFYDIQRLMIGFEELASSKKNNLIEKLSEMDFIISISNADSKIYLKKPCDVYFPTDYLMSYFEGQQSVYFVNEDLYKKFGKNKVESFLTEVGVLKYPKRVMTEKEAPISIEERRNRVRYTGRCIRRIDYEYDGLDNILDNLSESKSIILWNTLLKTLERLDIYDAENFFKGYDEWEYYGKQTLTVDAVFTIKLRDANWILDKNGIFRKPCELMFDQVSDSYKKEGKNLDVLKKVLKFIPDYELSLPQEDKERLFYARKIPLERLRKIFEDEQKKPESKETESDDYDLKNEPGQIEISDYIPQLRERKMTYYTPSEKVNANRSENKDGFNAEERLTSVDRMEIGYNGEKSVYTYLKEKYQRDLINIKETPEGFNASDENGSIYEIIWANKNGNRGIGYDFLIKKNEDLIEYIEVKSKTSKSLEIVEMTSAQWALAKELFYEGFGEKYSIYIVKILEAGKREIKKLNNPFKLWKEGKIEAHPINLIL